MKSGSQESIEDFFLSALPRFCSS